MGGLVRCNKYGRFSDPLILGPVLSVVFIAAVAKAALLTGGMYVLFPELAALSYDVFKRPAGAWASSPVMLAITPAVTAALGTAVTQMMAYSLCSVAVTVAAAILIVRWMRSPIVPAISAAFLPLAFGITNWWYPVSIAAVLVFLALVSTAYGRALVLGHGGRASLADTAMLADEVRHTPSIRTWPLYFLFAAFILLVYGLAVVTGLRQILFPPLVVIAFEIFVHGNVRRRAIRPFALSLACTITAGAGLAALSALGAGPLSVAVSLVAGMLTLRALRLHFPPALTVGLLPQIMLHADWRFVFSVALGVTALTGAVLLARLHPVDQRVSSVKG